MRYRYAAGDGSELRGEALWASADDPGVIGYGGVITGNSYGIVGAVWPTHGALLLFPDSGAINRQVSVVYDVSNAGAGLTATSLQAGYDIVPNRFGATLGLATAQSGSGDSLGTEFNVRLRTRPQPLLDIAVAAAVVTGSQLSVDPWTAIVTLDWVVF